jgi:predicted DsbA family dithiol-disulfide isomerase
MGISSVPAFIINNKYLLSGGQPVENFIQSLTEIAEKEA